MTAATERTRARIRVEGTVQGVGFRPFVHGLAGELGLAGFVGNDAEGVFVEVEGPDDHVRDFLARLATEAPPLATIESISSEVIQPVGDVAFTIVASPTGGVARTLVSPDIASCDACLREVGDPHDRRYRYPFTNCTDCGPRFTIVRDVPYDRPRTTMAGFEMCAACADEYADPADRRFHAQPTCCPDCGPRLTLTLSDGTPVRGDVVEQAAIRLRSGDVLAVKGLGGYHLAALATDGPAVATLRRRKHREQKPFALMVADVDEARRLCEADQAEAGLLMSRARPIVLLRRRPGAAVADAVAPGNRSLGLMLPYTPLHHLLLEAVGAPIVLTSGNVSDEPIAYRDEDAARRLTPIADAVLGHDRPIHIRTDDSVARVVAGRPVVLRRSRGYVPSPVALPLRCVRPILAVGAELKSTIAVASGSRALVSHHIGDLENHETYTSFLEAIEHLARLFDVRPEVVAHDLHPGYLSTEHARMLDLPLVAVQHHHAHIASCLADNGVDGVVIGVAFDGTGYGEDATVWGGELLVADLTAAERVGHLSPVPLPGAAAAIREPWRTAAAHLDAAYDGEVPDVVGLPQRIGERYEQVLAVARSGVNSPLTSSVGRLFDAVASILDVRDAITYEGQAAIELEQLADPRESGSYAVDPHGEAMLELPAAQLVRAVVDDLMRGVDRACIAGRFHNALADLVAVACGRVRDQRGLGTVALSGGVFQNALLLERTVDRLEAAGFTVLTHRQVPPNDGGISLGQVAVAAARDHLPVASG